MALVTVSVFIFVLNVFFGYWRANTKRFSLAWILAIHIPVPIDILFRIAFLGWQWSMIPIFVVAFAAGQFAGGYVRRRMAALRSTPLTSFLLSDVIRILL